MARASNLIKEWQEDLLHPGSLILSIIAMILMNVIGFSAQPNNELLSLNFIVSMFYFLAVQLTILQASKLSWAMAGTQMLLLLLLPVMFALEWNLSIFAWYQILLVLQLLVLLWHIGRAVLFFGVLAYAIFVVVMPDFVLYMWRNFFDLFDSAAGSYIHASSSILLLYSLTSMALVALLCALVSKLFGRVVQWVRLAHLLILSLGCWGTIVGAVASTA